MQHQIDTYYLAVIYNTTRIKEIYLDICSNYFTFKLKNNTLGNSIISKQIDYLIDTVESKLVYLGLETLNIRHLHRKKRGLVDGLGSIVKAITGNLDNNDAIKFENEIKLIQSSLGENLKRQDKTIGIMSEFMKNYENNLQIMQSNQKNIESAVNRYSAQSNVIQSINIYSEIERSLQQLYDKLASLENAITFSHLGRMHPSIITPNHFLEELNYVQNEIALNLPFAPNLNQIHLWEKATTVKAYSTNESLNFILEIPLVTKQLYNLLHLYSIPNDVDTILIPKNPLLILGNEEFAYPQEQCLEVLNDDFICKHLEWQSLHQSEDCIAQLIQHQEPHNCTYAKASFKDNIIQQIKENSWIIIMKQEEVVKIICGKDIQYNRSKGVSLVTINSECTVELAGRILQTHQKYINIEETIPLPRVQRTQETIPIKLNLENIQLDNLKDILQNTLSIQQSSENHTPIIATNPSWSSILLYIILILAATGAIIYKRWWKAKSRKITTQTRKQEEEEEQGQKLQPSARFSLRGGGVMSV